MFGKPFAPAWLALFLLSGGCFMSVAGATDDARFRMIMRNNVAFPVEMFGPGANELSFPTPRLNIQLSVLFTTGVAEGGRANFTYTLTNGARFGYRDLNVTDFAYEDAGNNGSRVVTTLVSGGRVGDSSVTFQVDARSGGAGSNLPLSGTNAISLGDRLELNLPGLLNIGGLGVGDSVRVRVNIEALVATALGPNFRTADSFTNEDGIFFVQEDEVLQVIDRLTLFATPPDEPPAIQVNRPEQFATSTTAITLADTSVRQGVVIALLNVGVNYSPDNRVTDFELSAEDRFRLEVEGEFHERTLVFIDLDEDMTVDVGEVISPADGLSVSGIGAGAEALIYEPISDYPPDIPVYLVPDGETDIASADYRVTLGLDFANDSFRDETPASAAVRIQLSGLSQDGFAYAIPNCTQTDRARIRVTNETASALSLFVQGVDQAGTELGLMEVDARLLRGGDSVQLLAKETVVLFSRHVEQVFGLNNGQYDKNTLCTANETWQGRAQLSFYASDNITVTPLIRGTDGRLRDLGGFTGLEIVEGAEQKHLGR